VLFGTGIFLSDSDRTTSTQALYGLHDMGSNIGNPVSGALVGQSIGTQVSGTSGGFFHLQYQYGRQWQ
jgi:type IV pilus assembly protein PilY1